MAQEAGKCYTSDTGQSTCPGERKELRGPRWTRGNALTRATVPQRPPAGVCRNVGSLLSGMSHFSKKCQYLDCDVKSPYFKWCQLIQNNGNIVNSAEQPWATCAGRAWAWWVQEVQRVPRETETAFEGTAPPPLTPPGRQGAGLGAGHGEGVPIEPHHVDDSGHLVDDGLRREVEHAEPAWGWRGTW